VAASSFERISPVASVAQIRASVSSPLRMSVPSNLEAGVEHGRMQQVAAVVGRRSQARDRSVRPRQSCSIPPLRQLLRSVDQRVFLRQRSRPSVPERTRAQVAGAPGRGRTLTNAPQR
jgi:hypothetical protein